MDTQQAALRPGRANLALITLFLGMFVLGSAELLVVGVLNVIATDLDVSISAAGTLVTVYALGLAIGGPILTALSIKMNRRTVLVGALGLFVMGNVVAVLTTSYGLFLATRTLTGAIQGLFIAAAFAVGVFVVPPQRMGRAIAVVVSGVSVSAALGVPLGTLVGQALGWRGSFAAIVVLALLTLVATLTLIPSVPSAGGVGGQARYAFAPRVLAVLVLHALTFAAVFAALTYIVPFLQHVTGVPSALISLFLFAYGAATAVGSFGGGRFADKNAARALILGTIGATAALLSLYLFQSNAILVALALLALGLFAMGMAPSLQYRVLSLAGPGSTLASSLPASAVNVGIAFGSFAGGRAIDSFTAAAPVVTGLIIAAIAIPAAWATSFLEPPAIEDTTAGPATEPVAKPA